jgi:hypothetical protein
VTEVQRVSHLDAHAGLHRQGLPCTKGVTAVLQFSVLHADDAVIGLDDFAGTGGADDGLVEAGLGQNGAFGDFLALLHRDLESRLQAERILARLLLLHVHGRLAALVTHFHQTGDIRELRGCARVARFEKLLHAGETLCDVGAFGDASHVEGAHGQLRAGFADALRGDDADRRADLHRLVVAQIAPVALLADALLRLARHDGPHGDLRDFVLVSSQQVRIDLRVPLGQHLAFGIDEIRPQCPTEDAALELLPDALRVLPRDAM